MNFYKFLEIYFKIKKNSIEILKEKQKCLFFLNLQNEITGYLISGTHKYKNKTKTNLNLFGGIC